MSDTQSDCYLVPAVEGETELTVKRSRFIARVRWATSEEEARDVVRRIGQAEPAANHHCWAYRVGFPAEREYFSDAGEPSGTAGKPILGAIQRAQVTNTVVVVTRYFGGIKLGVRGLIEAYGKAATAGLEVCGKREEQLGLDLEARISYEGQRPLFYQLLQLGIGEDQIISEYGADILIGMTVPLSRKEEVEDLFRGYVHKGWVLRWNWVEGEQEGPDLLR